MNIATSNRQAAKVDFVRAGLAPEVLLAEGILRNPEKPQDALLSAKSLLRSGRYLEAREILLPHSRNSDSNIRLQTLNFLAQAAKAGAGREWENLLAQVIVGYAEMGQIPQEAAARRDMGAMYLAVGKLQLAEGCLKKSVEGFIKAGKSEKAAQSEILRARVQLRSGASAGASKRLDKVIKGLGRGRTLALARLERALVRAARGENSGSRKDLVKANRFFAISANSADRIRARLVHAEALILEGDDKKAAAGLSRLIKDIEMSEDLPVLARAKALLGRSLLNLDPTKGRRYLTRAKHIYTRLGYSYEVTKCDINLARIENRLGLNAIGRLKAFKSDDLRQWPGIAANFQLARAEIMSKKIPEKAHASIMRIREYALAAGNYSLVSESDRILKKEELGNSENSSLTPVVSLADNFEAQRERELNESNRDTERVLLVMDDSTGKSLCK
ncbi:hypothetical protein KAI87_07960, partial [Myxococcota bacterium]|nr:hypothetical protein [Myxococcota bacterium]